MKRMLSILVILLVFGLPTFVMAQEITITQIQEAISLSRSGLLTKAEFEKFLQNYRPALVIKSTDYETHTAYVDGTMSIKELVNAGNYKGVNTLISMGSYIEGYTKSGHIEFCLIPLESGMLLGEARKMLKNKGFRTANMKEHLSFSAEYTQTKHTELVSLSCEIQDNNGNCGIMNVIDSGEARMLDVSFALEISASQTILAVRLPLKSKKN